MAGRCGGDSEADAGTLTRSELSLPARVAGESPRVAGDGWECAKEVSVGDKGTDPDKTKRDPPQLNKWEVLYTAQ